MNAGALNRKVTIQQHSGAEDALGQPVPGAWVPLAEVWANIRFLSGVESIKAGAETATTKASIRIRYRPDVTAAMRVVYGATTYQVKAVLPDEAGRRHVDLQCEVIA